MLKFENKCCRDLVEGNTVATVVVAEKFRGEAIEEEVEAEKQRPESDNRRRRTHMNAIYHHLCIRLDFPLCCMKSPGCNLKQLGSVCQAIFSGYCYPSR